MQVAVQGLRGSFHHEAATKLLPDVEFDLLECQSFHDVFKAVSEGQVEYGVSAIENSFHGSINPVYRLLERHELWVSGEVTLQIEQYLIGCAAGKLTALDSPLTLVMSQGPALAQCELWLDKHLPSAQRVETHDTAGSVRQVVDEQLAHQVAIAGKAAAELYKGTIIAGPINDDPHNYTRFVLLQKQRQDASSANRTQIILKTNHTPGSLYRALGIFAEAGINLSKLDSHPIVGDQRHYAFYIDLDAGLQNTSVQQAFARLEADGNQIRVLGSYPLQA